MDHDAMGRHVHSLLAFKKKIEEMLGGASGDETAASVLGGRIDEVQKHLDELGETVTAIQQVLEHLDPALKELPDLFEGLAGLKDMAEWFAQNREGLEVLLSMGDTASETANAGAGDVAGAGSAEKGTHGAAAGGAPLSAPVAELNNDPSARAEAAVAEPTAQP